VIGVIEDFDSVIAVDRLAVSFERADGGRLQALEGFDLVVRAGEVVSIIGPNGCGKSTLLRVIAGLLSPESGRVLVDGAAVTRPSPNVGIVFQEPRLLPWRTVASNVSYPLELAGTPATDRAERTRAAIEHVGIGEFAGARPSQLSGGLAQRAALARALAPGPDVLLLDEPFSALDALTRERFDVDLLGSWVKPGSTILAVTHSIAEAIFLADRVIVMSPRPGRVVADIEVEIARPRSFGTLDEALASRLAREIRGLLEVAA
jgi:NitT/TauT family transport system ATP-binding protein